MLACLVFVSKTPTELAKQHLKAFSPMLDDIILGEQRDLLKIRNISQVNLLHSHDDLWLCNDCSKIIINSIVWSTCEDQTYCLSCCRSKTNRVREDLAISFRFEHPNVLWLMLQRTTSAPAEAPSSSCTAPPASSMQSPADLLGCDITGSEMA